MFEARDKEPLPDDETHRQDLLGAIATEEVRQDLTPFGLAELASKVLKRAVAEGEVSKLASQELDQLLTALIEPPKA